MEAWEFAACVRAHNRKIKAEGRDKLAQAWQTAALTGAAFAGKLKKLKYYMDKIDGDTKKSSAPKISREEFEEKLRIAEGRAGNGVKKS